MKRRTFLELLAVAPIAALAPWRPTVATYHWGVDWGSAPCHMVLTVYHVGNCDVLHIPLRERPPYTRVEVRGAPLRVVAGAAGADGLWFDIGHTLLPPECDLEGLHIALRELAPERFDRELVIFGRTVEWRGL